MILFTLFCHRCLESVGLVTTGQKMALVTFLLALALVGLVLAG